MTKLNKERQSAKLAAVKPCGLFDPIGGTSTGGYAKTPFLFDLPDSLRLIATMPSRLGTDVDKCISEYTELMKTVFDEQSSLLPCRKESLPLRIVGGQFH